MGGVLAAISNQETQNCIENYIDLSGNVGYWIGGERKSGVWTWTDGSPWTGNWGGGNHLTENQFEDALLIYDDYTWRDWQKSHFIYYLCQY